jgi:hypothetical protein
MLYIIKKRSGAIEGKGLVERGHRRRPVEAIRLSQVFFGSRNDQKKQAAGILTGYAHETMDSDCFGLVSQDSSNGDFQIECGVRLSDQNERITWPEVRGHC